MTALNQQRGGSGEPLVLLHGIGSSLGAWGPVRPALEAERDVIAIDLPGFGSSSPLPEGEYSDVDGLATGVERELDRLGLDVVHLVGNSLGGWIALELARRGRARSVVGLSPGGMRTPREAAYSRALLRTMFGVCRVIAPHAEAVTRPVAGRMALFSAIVSRPWRLEPEAAAHAVRALAGAPTFLDTLDRITVERYRSLDEIRCPVRIAWGTQDRLLLPRQGPRFVRMIPGAELRPLPGLGHVPMSDDPDMVARAILDPIGPSASAG